MPVTPQPAPPPRYGFRRASPFHRTLKRVPGHGPQPCRAMFIGEKPGYEEANRGLPFVGLSGQYLTIFLNCAAVDRKSVYITNLVKEFTDYTKPTAQEIVRDHDELVQEIVDCNPEIIGLVGAYAIEHVLYRKSDIEVTHGIPFHVDALFGGELTRPGGYVVIPMLHPANCIHAPAKMPMVLDDILTLGKFLDGEVGVRPEDAYKGIEDYRVYNPSASGLLIESVAGVDTESLSDHSAWCQTLSCQTGSSLFVAPGTSVKYLNKVYLHNSLHDLGVLRKLGTYLEEGQYVDTMVLAYLLCVEPQGLKALAFRHCGAERHSYDEMVLPAQEAISESYLFEALSRAEEWPLPEPQMIRDKGKYRVYKPKSIATRVSKILNDYTDWKAGKRDDQPVDLLARWEDVDEGLRKPVEAKLGRMRHADLSDIEFDKAMVYACHDSADTFRIGPILEAKIKAMGLEEAARVDHAILPCIDRMQEVGIGLARREFWDDMEAKCIAQMDKSQWQVFQMTGHDINPASDKQVAELLYGHGPGQLGLTPPKYTEKTQRGSTDGISLEELLSIAPVVQPIIDYKEANKVRGTYVIPLRALAVQGDRVHSTMRITRTTTGRLSMADPPLHQIPIISDLGKECRNGFVPPDGSIFGDWDLNQIEMRLMAHESRDEELCRLFIEGKDIHSETACKIFSIPMSQLSVNDRGKVDDYRRTVAKHAGFGIINGITEHGLLNYLILNRCRKPDGSMWTLDDCIMLLKEWFGIYRGVKLFQNRCIEEVRQTGLARESVSGRIVYLPAVWSPQKWVAESAERMSYVMHTQGGAASLFKRALKAAWDFIKKMPGVEPLLWMHDELLCELPDDEDTKTTADAMVRWAMENTTKLRVPVLADGGFGYSWGLAH